MARSSSIVTISLPPKMAAWSVKIAKKQQMTRSELIRTALRNYLEEQQANMVENKLASRSRNYRKMIQVARKQKKVYSVAQMKKRLG